MDLRKKESRGIKRINEVFLVSWHRDTQTVVKYFLSSYSSLISTKSSKFFHFFFIFSLLFVEVIHRKIEREFKQQQEQQKKKVIMVFRMSRTLGSFLL